MMTFHTMTCTAAYHADLEKQRLYSVVQALLMHPGEVFLFKFLFVHYDLLIGAVFSVCRSSNLIFLLKNRSSDILSVMQKSSHL